MGEGTPRTTSLQPYPAVTMQHCNAAPASPHPSPLTSCHTRMILLMIGGMGLEGYSSYRDVVAVIGVLWLSWLTLKLLKALAGDFCTFFLAPLGISRINLKKYGSWAVVIGASGGIGRGYALELARQGLNVVIMSRSKERLQNVAVEIEKKYGRDIRVISVDFSEGLRNFSKLAEQLQGLDVGILVNNVGLCYDHPEYFDEVNPERFHNIIEVNCQSMVQMTKLLLPKMLEKKRGIVVNISSSSGVLNLPMIAVYCASKCFVNSFSEGLRKEYTDKGIIVQYFPGDTADIVTNCPRCVVPCFVVTSMVSDWGVQEESLFTPDPIRYARAAVATIGIRSFTRGYYPHELFGYFLDHMPVFVTDWIFLPVMKEMKAFYLQQKAKKQ